MTTPFRIRAIGPAAPATGHRSYSGAITPHRFEQRDDDLVRRVMLERQRRALLPDDRTPFCVAPFPATSDAAPKASPASWSPAQSVEAGLRNRGEQ